MSTAARPRVLVYAQHLSGVGHYVRTYEIARALTTQFEVHWIEGGRSVPHRSCASIEVIDIPRLQRGADGSLQALFTDQPMPCVQAERRRILIDAIGRLRPDVFLVEYFPFSKWELAPELLPAIRAVRRQGGMVLCSIRDIVRQTRFEAVDAQVHAARTIDWLRQCFDALLVHADQPQQAPALRQAGLGIPRRQGRQVQQAIRRRSGQLQAEIVVGANHRHAQDRILDSPLARISVKHSGLNPRPIQVRQHHLGLRRWEYTGL